MLFRSPFPGIKTMRLLSRRQSPSGSRPAALPPRPPRRPPNTQVRRRRQFQPKPAKEDSAAAFHQATGHNAILSFGSSGGLLHPDGPPAPPFGDIPPSPPDAERPRQAEAGRARRPRQAASLMRSRGGLVLYSAQSPLWFDRWAARWLKRGGFRGRFAIHADPVGRALRRSPRWRRMKEARRLFPRPGAQRSFTGTSITQTYQFVATRRRRTGLRRASRPGHQGNKADSRWLVARQAARADRSAGDPAEDRRPRTRRRNRFMKFLRGPARRSPFIKPLRLLKAR